MWDAGGWVGLNLNSVRPPAGPVTLGELGCFCLSFLHHKMDSRSPSEGVQRTEFPRCSCGRHLEQLTP